MTRAEDTVPERLAAEIAGHLRRGEHATAAAALLAAGFPVRAAAIYEQIFEHLPALEAYVAGGDIVSAVRVALAMGDGARIDALVGHAIAIGRGEALLASLQRARRHLEVARIHLARGDLQAAAEAFERGEALDRAAQCLEDAGDTRAAGLFLERHLESHPDDAEAALRLGRIVARFGRHDDGIALLQRAVRRAAVPDVMLCRAAPAMTVSFIQLGYEHAAGGALARWQAAASRLRGGAASVAGLEGVPLPPDSLEAFVRSERAAALAAIQTTSSVRADGELPSPPPPSEGFVPRDDAGLDAFLGVDTSESASARPGPPARAECDENDGLLLAGRYLLGEPLGGGGVGQVFRAFDAFADRPVAVKIFGALALASEAVQAFARAARAFAALQHPAVVPLVELNMAHGFVVTELVDAPTVEERLRPGGDGGWLLPAVQALLDLLASAHRVGLVHGGLRPTHIFLPPVGVRVVDVGSRHLLALRSTETGGLSSVWPYLAPEQLFGAPATASGDLYAVGAILYRALTGRTPFAHAEDDRRRPPPPASSFVPAVPATWDAFLARALEPDPARRFQDAVEMATALPGLPRGHMLPPALTVESERSGGAVLEGQRTRYARGALVHREERGAVRFYEGTDLLLDRTVWLVEADDARLLEPLTVCARLWRGVQPVYDVLPEACRVVVARDAVGRTADMVSLRDVPQGLARDLAGVARALDTLHGQGWCLDGFPVERALGPIGPRLRLAPAPLFVPATSEGIAADARAFGMLVEAAFALDPHETLDVRTRLLRALSERRALDRGDVDTLQGSAWPTPWSAFLDAVAHRLVLGASSRVVARLVASILRG